MTVALAVGWAASQWVAPHRRLPVGVVGGLLMVAPVPAVAAGAVAALWAWRGRLARRRDAMGAVEGDLVVLADLVALGLTAGLPPRAALDAASRWVVPELGDEVRLVLAEADRRGVAAALADAGGHGARLYRLLARAVVSGAPAADAVESYAAERRHADHAARLADARKLPVRLLVPLALLILPGFVVLAVGPAVIDALERLGEIG
ncbi:MAG TPA: type II secretion system F family protein [Acidimicrobiia bacterium]|nr:type II secretion system F family protein [Acidimicrobiia bacterium]